MSATASQSADDPAAARTRRPAILAVDDEPAVLAAVSRDLRRGFGERYRILRAGSGAEALEILAQVRARGEQVALLVADQRMPGMSGTDYLVEARKLVPEAKRVLLTAYADTEAAIAAINEVALDFYLLKPWDPPEENLYPVIEDLLTTWESGSASASSTSWRASSSRSTSSQRYGTWLRARNVLVSAVRSDHGWPTTRTIESRSGWSSLQSPSRSSMTG